MEMADNSWTRDWRSITPKARQDDRLRETLEQLQAEVTALRASRERLVLAADADRRRLERELHEGMQQHLIALAVNLQLAESSIDSDPAAATSFFERLGRDVQEALDEAARLAQRIYALPLELGGLAAALRSAAVSAGVSASVDVSAGSSYRAEIVQTVYSCWLEALEHGSGETPVSITVREEVGALAFEVSSNFSPDADPDRLRDRLEALGGRLTIRSEPGGRVRVSGWLPLSR
jgi:signal transduction histidine kinase